MRSEALQRLETLLDGRRLGGTLTRSEPAPRAVASTGVAALDEQLGGGWPAGAISELVGRPSTGRTGLLVSTLARAAGEGQVVALVDTCDRFDPRSAAGNGLDPDRLLWVRGAPITVEQARPAMLDRALRLAVRAFDLILRAGGFGVVVLDLADVPEAAVRRLPPATWLRLAHVNEGRSTVGVIAGQGPTGRSARGMSVRLEGRPVWQGSSAQSRRFAGFETTWRVQSATRPLSLPVRGAEVLPGRRSELLPGQRSEVLKDCG